MAETPSALPDLLTRDLDPADLTTAVVRANLEQLAAGAVVKAGDDTEATAVSRLAVAKRRPAWKLPLLLACLAFAVLGIAAYRDLSLAFAGALGSDRPHPWRGMREGVLQRLADPDAIYRPGDQSAEEWCERTRKAFDRQPDSVAAYYLYVSIFQLIRGEMPPDFNSVTARLEPDNAIWPLLKSNWQTKRAWDFRVSRGEPDTEWTSRAVDCLRKAAGCPRVDYHLQEIGQLWRRDLHPVTVAEAVALSPSQGNTEDFILHPEYYATSALIFGAKQLSEPEARGDFLRMTGPLMIRYLLATGREGGIPTQTLTKYAVAAGLTDEAARLRRLDHLVSSAGQEMAARPKEAGAWGAVLDIHWFWPDFHEDWGESELDLRLMNRVAALKTALLSSGAFCLVAGLLVWLRLIPRPVIPAKIARCVAPMIDRPGRIVRASVVLVMTLILAWASAGVVENSNDHGSEIFLAAIGGGALLGLSFVFQSARISVARSTAILGLRPTGRRLMLGRLMKLLALLAVGFWVASTHVKDFQIFAIFMAGSVILVWLACIGLGYANPVNSTRHRLMARFLLPVFFTASLVLGLAGMGVGAFERHLVQEAWAAAPGPLSDLSPETKAGLEALLKEWQ
ncbi:MAG: hypothetical protein JWO82_4173 [Akkermansiaceae bacterium]|nr:hypothetical protein [Akkermansiaceae bacterium]